MSNLLTYIQSQTKPKYTDLQQTSLSQYIKTQTAKTPQQTVTPKPTNPSTPKYGTVNGKTTLPSHIENQGLYNLSNEKNGITAVTEGFGLGVSNTLKNIANTIDTVKAYTAVPAGVYKDIQSAFYDVNKAGLVAGIVDSNQQKYGKNSTYRSNIESDIVQRNNTQNQWTQQVYNKHKDVKYGDKIIGIGQGVASTLPYMAVSGLTASPEIGRLALGWNTLGDAVGEALSDGATFDQATGYALSQAGKEMAISKLAGGIPYLDDGLFSTGGITEKYISNPLLQALINRGVDIVGEGAEEAASTYLTPYLKRAFYDKTAPNATPQQLWNSFKSGANISAILGIASGAGKLATQAESFRESDKVYKVYFDEADKKLGLYNNIFTHTDSNDLLTKKALDDSLVTIEIGKSLGASAKNYPVKMPDSNQRVKLAEGQTIVGKTFAGKGTNKEIRARHILSSRYNIDPDEFEKVSGNGFVIIDGKPQKAEIHWYEANGRRFEMKIKRYIE